MIDNRKLYLCDPRKNGSCFEKARGCGHKYLSMNGGCCFYTHNAEYALDGTKDIDTELIERVTPKLINLVEGERTAMLAEAAHKNDTPPLEKRR